MHWTLVPACLTAFGLCCAAQPASTLPPELLTLAKIKVRMNEVLTRQPNYTCVEQIERSRRLAPRYRFELVDMLRLEVALVDGQELFAWPGSTHFEEHDLEKLVPTGGAIGNGNFAIYAHTVFRSHSPRFEHRGIEELKGRRLVRYDFWVAQMHSGLNLRVNARSAVVGFHGTFWADPESLDVVRLEVHADDIPTALGLSASVTSIEYARVHIGQNDFLLPSASELTMTHFTGIEDRNIVRFSACRQYTGESVLRFSEAPLDSAPESPAAKFAKREVQLPVGVTLELTLDMEIDSDTSMVGDPVQATLRRDIRFKKEVLVPKGATVTGRIVRLERHTGHTVIDIHFANLETETLHAAFEASVEEAQVLPAQGSLRDKTHSGDTNGILLKGNRLRLPRGFRVTLRIGR